MQIQLTGNVTEDHTTYSTGLVYAVYTTMSHIKITLKKIKEH